jgi:molybdate transport system substrate-binding protein
VTVVRFRSSPTGPAVGSLVVLAALAAALVWRGSAGTGSAPRPLIMYCAESGRVPMEAIAAEYEARTGHPVELRFGPSETLLTQVGLVNPSEPADLFLPADAYYIDQARARDLTAEVLPVADMRAVLLTAPTNPKGIAAWSDLLREGIQVAVANPGAAIGKLAREHLARTGKWLALAPHVVDVGSVTQAATAAKIGSADAAIVWDAVAFNYPGQGVLELPELAGVTARVELAVLKQSADPAAALQLARYITDPARGLAHFRAAGFRVREVQGARAAP